MSPTAPCPGSCCVSSRDRFPIANACVAPVAGSMYFISRARWLKCVVVRGPCGTSGQYMKSI
ncbi:hypothetical protein BE08_44510 [Sorangium cellulosum]|uniref:Uncharacterized protein n=1 Tax=Sorangium cellulosum TaxID=56 RepID=A0A150P5Z1_SORCE|nr:hypothetical protein BE08_44510 [Sorangium cellulosum]